LLRFNGSEFENGSLGPVKLGDLTADVSFDGSIELTSGQTLDSSLGIADSSATTLVFVPEPSALLLLSLGFPIVLWLGQRRTRRSRVASMGRSRVV
jgi:hypothetical protein